MVINKKPVSEGIADGKVYIYEPFSTKVDESTIDEKNIENEIESYHLALSKAKEEISLLVNKLQETKETDKQKIMEAHLELINDPVMEEEIQDLIKENHYHASKAVDEVYNNYISVFEASDSDIIRERTSDLRDIKNRILRCLENKKEVNLSQLTEPVIVVTHDLVPSDTASMDKDKVLGIITELGGETSHTAIMARSYEIPAILGVDNVVNSLKNGQEILLDALEGTIITDPNEEQKKLFFEKKKKYFEDKEDIKKYFSKECLTKDGKRIEIKINIGSSNKNEIECAPSVDGVGLFRTEFLYMDKETLPTEEEQFIEYKKVLETFKNKTVIIRTLDIGGDKKLKCLTMPKEDNPFLGKRAIRLCLENIDLFKTQLRALARASVYGKLYIMFPMIASLTDFRRVKKVYDEVLNELDNEKIPYNKNTKIGIMIEIPAACASAEKFAKEVDFASIGSNDLIQYSTATDRMNPEISMYYQKFNPGVITLIKNTADAFNKARKPLSVCGEMAGDIQSAVLLVGLGISSLSMNKSSVSKVKKMLSNVNYADCLKLADNTLKLDTSEEIEDLIKDFCNINY